MLINYTLVPVETVQPWGSPGNLSLSWFALTDGQYWIKAGNSTLFEYSDHAQAAGVSRYCEYQVVRLYEDWMEILPHILEPVPPSLVHYLSGDTGSAWRQARDLWYDRNEDLDSDQFREIDEASITWTRNRSLDSAYLSPPVNIVIWSDAANVYLEWDNRTKVFNGQPVWTALRGKYQLSRDAFVTEIRSFHLRLMEQMAHRVDQVLSGALSAEINIDLPGLAREQEQRCHTLDGALKWSPHTDWQAVETAINEIVNTQSSLPD
jgi:hypothetical protein